jgi:hypothetical protein
MLTSTKSATDPVTGLEGTPQRPTGEPPAGAPPSRPAEVGGRPGPEPTRFGDWEKSGRCIDF